MPKNYISSDNISSSLLLIAKNLLDNYNLKEFEVSGQLGRIFKGVIDQDTINGYMPDEYRRPYGILQTCEKCGKKRIKDMPRHLSISHKKLKECILN